jgi:hypothetical protein
MAVDIRTADFTDPVHRSGIVDVLDSYAGDPVDNVRARALYAARGFGDFVVGGSPTRFLTKALP